MTTPRLDLLIRLWLAQAFLVVQVHQMMSGAPLSAALGSRWWTAALHGVMVSSVGLAVQTACPLLLAAGLLARPAAAAMVLQTLLSPDPGLGASPFWAALLLRVVLLGPGRLSVDLLLHGGLDSIAVPGAASIGAALAWLRQVARPYYQLGLRLWTAAAAAGTALAAIGVTHAMQPGISPGLPTLPPAIAGFAPGLALALALSLVIGVAARPVALALLLVLIARPPAIGDPGLPWALALALLAVHGAGAASVDGLLRTWFQQRAAAVDRSALPHVVVVGGGFGGVAAARGLRRAPCRVTLVDRCNHHLFQPLLYQVATAGLSPADIATPLRAIFRNQDNVRVLLGSVAGLDTEGKAVLLDHTAGKAVLPDHTAGKAVLPDHTAGKAVLPDRSRIPYDYLVLATGARHGYLGHDDWAPFAPGLKTIEDATAIRRRLLLAFEEAEGAATATERRDWLTFVIVGGGPTGVELAGAIAELAHHGMVDEFREIDPASARVILVQSGPRLLPAFPNSLSHQAARALTALGVEVRLNSRVEAVGANSVTLSGQLLPARTVLWAAGVMASSAAAWLGIQPDRAGRVPVGDGLSVPGLDGVYAVGDTAASDGWNGTPVPGLAPAAKQGGAFVAEVIRARLAGRPGPAVFRYRHWGSLATVGRRSAVADFGVLRMRGALAWWLWGAAHIGFLVGGRNRVAVMTEWLWAYLTFRRSTRLITGL